MNAKEKLTLKEVCEHGWVNRDCDKFDVGDLEDSMLKQKANERLQLSACRSGIKLRSIDAPLNYERATMFNRAARFERSSVTENLTTNCNPNVEVGDPHYCAAAGTDLGANPQNACLDDGRGAKRCQQCIKDSECALQMGSEEFVCRPYLDMHNEIIYDNSLESNRFLKHGYKFNTCQRLGRHAQNLKKLNRMPFAENQRQAKMQMEIAKGQSKQTTTVMVSVLAAALLGVAVYLILRKLKFV